MGFVSCSSCPFRIWKPLFAVGSRSSLIITLFVVGFGGRFFSGMASAGRSLHRARSRHAAGAGWIAFRVHHQSLIIHFGDMDGETHGSARFATDKETAAPPAPIPAC